MTTCVVVDGSGYVVAEAGAPANCSQFVLMSSDDYYAVQHSGVLPPLSISEAEQIGIAILLCWVTGSIWGWISEALDA